MPGASFVPTVRFTILIPARNEEKNIADCLQSIEQLDYPKTLLEVIVIDDFSTDTTAAIVQQFSNVKLLKLEDTVKDKINSYKKKAIETGIAQSTGDFIVTTDADCIVPAGWLTNFALLIQEQQTAFIVAPVAIKDEANSTISAAKYEVPNHTSFEAGFINVFQDLDFLSLQGITGASAGTNFHSMCNGANLCYSKKAFYEVNGFQNIDHIASGDDMLLMYKILKRFPGSVHYCHAASSIVQTSPVETVKAFFQQRIRWASKADKYDDKRISIVLLLVYLLNAFLLLLFISGFFNPFLWILLSACLFVKTIVELWLLIPVANFFKKEKLLLWFPLMQPFHILYTVVAGWLGKFGNYEWKGRQPR